MNKTYHLLIQQPNLPPQLLILTLTPSHQRGYCFKCNLEREIWVISERQTGNWVSDERKFCRSCSLISLADLEESDCQFENKKELIKEIRTNLLKGLVFDKKSPELLESYA